MDQCIDFSICEVSDDGQHKWGPESEEVIRTFGGAIREDTTECTLCDMPRKYAVKPDGR